MEAADNPAFLCEEGVDKSVAVGLVVQDLLSEVFVVSRGRAILCSESRLRFQSVRSTKC